MEPKKGKWGLWYAGTRGFATRDQAQAYIDGGDARQRAAMGAAPENGSSDQSWKWFGLLLVVAGGLAWYFLHYNSSDEIAKREIAAERKDCSDSGMAFVMSQRFVEKALRAPASAKFPYESQSQGVTSDPIGNCRFVIQAYVDSQNGFGAMMRTPYSVEMEYVRKEKVWRAHKLKLG